MKTIRVKDQSTQTTPSLTTRPPFRKLIEHSTPFETPELVKNFRLEDTVGKSSNLILEPSKTPVNFDQSSSPHFKLSVDETPDARPKSKIRKKSATNLENNSKKKLKFSHAENDDHLLTIDHSESKEFSIHQSKSKELASANQDKDHFDKESDTLVNSSKKRGRPKKKIDSVEKAATIPKSNARRKSESEFIELALAKQDKDHFDKDSEISSAKKRGRPKKNIDSVEKAATIPTRHVYKKEPKVPKSDSVVTMKTKAKQNETPLLAQKSSISVIRIKHKLEEDETHVSSPSGSPNTKRQKLHKKRENLMNKIELLEIKLEGYHNPDPNLRRSLRIRDKMVKNIQNDIKVLMNLVHFVEQQDEILMRQQRKYKEKNESTIKMPGGRRAKKLKIVSDEDFSS